MRKILAPLILLAATLLFQSGCINSGAVVVTGLRIALTGMERASDGTVMVSWRVENPNVTSYLLAHITTKVFLNGTLVGTILNDDPLGVAPQANVTKTSKLSGTSPATDRLVVEAAAHGPARYRVDSKLVIQIYGDDTEKGEISSSGSVTVVSK